MNIETSHAILLVSGNYALQLRDNKPTIAAAGKWSLFGGMRNKDETPLKTIRREVMEELSIAAEFRYLWFTDYYSDFLKAFVRTWFFVSDVSGFWSEYKLKEGQAIDVFNFEQIKTLDMTSVMKQAIERFHNQTGKICTR